MSDERIRVCLNKLWDKLEALETHISALEKKIAHTEALVDTLTQAVEEKYPTSSN